MDFERFALARDLLYLGALFLGAGTGSVLRRFRNAAVTAGLCFFSGALAALCAASIVSGWKIFAETALYLPLGVLACTAAAAVRFPRAAGFPLVLVTGVFVVWMGHACLRYPEIGENGLASVSHERDNFFYVSIHAPPDSQFSFRSADSGVIEIRALVVSVSKYFPLAGGKSRGIVTDLRYNNERLHAETRP